MPSSGVIKPDILSDDLEDNYVWEVTQGLMSLFPAFIEGSNSLNLGYAYDRMMKQYEIKNLERLDKRHASVDDYDTLNNQELNDRMKQMGVPFIKNDTSKAKKRRLKLWWEQNFGGGTEDSIKSVLYDMIGSGALDGVADPSDTTRILIVNPSAGGQWGDGDDEPSKYIDWADFSASSGAGGTWGDYTTVGKSDLDIQIYFNALGDYYFWENQDRKADIYYLTEQLKPAGSIYTLSNIYNGTLNSNLKYWWKMDRDGSDELNYENQLATNNGTHGDGLMNGSITLSSGSHLSGTLSGTGFSGTDATISFWMRMIAEYGNADRVVEMDGVAVQEMDVFVLGDGWSSGIQGSIGDGSVETLHTNDFSTGSWFNVIITASSGTGDYVTYVDNDGGTTVASSFTRLAILSGTKAVFGETVLGTNPSNIELEEVMILNRIITSGERAEIYEAGLRFIS